MASALVNPSMKKVVLLLVTVGFVSCADQTTKYHAIANLTAAFDARDAAAPSFGERLRRFAFERHPRPVRSITVIEDFWDLHYIENPGGFWSFLRNAPASWRLPFLLLTSLVIMVVLVVIYHRTPREQFLYRFALALALGGAVGNFLDRVRLGYVVDFVHWHWRQTASWPTFNVADAAITTGIVLLLIESFRRRPGVQKGAS